MSSRLHTLSPLHTCPPMTRALCLRVTPNHRHITWTEIVDAVRSTCRAQQGHTCRQSGAAITWERLVSPYVLHVLTLGNTNSSGWKGSRRDTDMCSLSLSLSLYSLRIVPSCLQRLHSTAIVHMLYVLMLYMTAACPLLSRPHSDERRAGRGERVHL